MKLRAVVFSLSVFLLIGATPLPHAAPVAPQPVSDWSFQGCFSPTGTGPCYDAYSHNGGIWMCAACGTTNKPNENKCRQLSAYELSHGRWCS